MSRLPPIEPPRCSWDLPDPSQAPEGVDLVGAGADLEAGTLLAAYRSGLFPMHVDLWGAHRLGWWSPDPRGVIPLDGLVVSRSLRRSARHFTVTIDTAFDDVVTACAREGEADRWIHPDIADAYRRLFDLGWAHSVEVRDGDEDGQLVGGLYGISVGGLFAGESMFHHATDASKVALMYLVEILSRDGNGFRMLDVQWRTEHLGSMGAIEIPRAEYLRRLRRAADVDEADFSLG